MLINNLFSNHSTLVDYTIVVLQKSKQRGFRNERSDR